MRYTFLLPIIALTFIACNKNDIETNCNKKIEFLANNLQQQCNLKTKGIELTNDNIRSFGVYAYYHKPLDEEITTSSPNFMLNQKVEKDGTTWKYSPIKYWPREGSISFCAYSPYSTGNNILLSTTSQSKGYPQITYITPDSFLNQIDLLISTPLLYQTIGDLNANKKIVIPFKHALSSINFKAKMRSAATFPIKIRSIKIESLKNKAEYNYNKLTWIFTTDAEEKSYELTIANNELENIDISKNTTSTPLFKANNTLMVLPQTIDNTDLITVTLELYLQGNTNVAVIKTASAKLNSYVKELSIGEKYNIELIVSAVGNVTITCKVDPWDNESIIVPDFD